MMIVSGYGDVTQNNVDNSTNNYNYKNNKTTITKNNNKTITKQQHQTYLLVTLWSESLGSEDDEEGGVWSPATDEAEEL